MDKDTRSKIQKATQAIRKLLEREYAEQLEGTFDIRQDGTVAEAPGTHLSAEQRLVRDKLVAAVRHREAGGLSTADAVAAWLREAAFTTLNRFVALKMLEARGLVQECVSKGDQSAGFKEFSGLAPGLVALPDKGYRLYIECLFDEIGREVKVLFDRLDPASLLWPRRTALTELLERLNADELAGVWGEDETIGWVYQYFNGEDERKQMRQESQAPRNSRELAVRNQFFTPRYVVQFLTDNTLGRMWYDMHHGQTKLKDLDYLVRRPTEIFFTDRSAEAWDGHYPEWMKKAARGDFTDLPERLTEGELAHLSLFIDGYELAKERGLGELGDWAGRLVDTVESGGEPPGSALDCWLVMFWLQRSWRWALGSGHPGESFMALWQHFYRGLRAALQKDEELSRADALKAPFFVPFRPAKDPREFRILDPACGSGHFLLYAFDLLLVIYEEAFEHGAFGPDYSSLDDLRKALPELILRHNLHGVDIDPRAAQIAALALWMRAQRAWKDFGVERKDRPTITRTHIVVAEPMPGDKAMVEEFAATLKPALLGELFKTMVDEMTLAGELGSLLKIEEHLASAIEKARKDWKARQTEKEGFLPGLAPEARQPELVLDEVTDEAFFTEAEDRILKALSEYASSASGALGVRRRLFAGDAAQGVAFVELMRKRFDVVLMNPPFGEPSAHMDGYLGTHARIYGGNILTTFWHRSLAMLAHAGRSAAIYDRTAAIKSSYEDFRREILIVEDRIAAHLDLGWGVLDASVETAVTVLEPEMHLAGLFADASRTAISEKAEQIRLGLKNLPVASQDLGFSSLRGTTFKRFPNCVLGHHFPGFAIQAFSTWDALGSQGVRVIAGHTLLSDRFFRAWWELPAMTTFMPNSIWRRMYNGGPYSRFTAPLSEAVVYDIGGKSSQLLEQSSTILRNPGLQMTGRVGFGKRGDFIDAHLIPPGFVSTVEGQAVVLSNDVDPYAILALLNSRVFQALINLYCGQHKYPGYVHLLPTPPLTRLAQAAALAKTAFELKQSVETGLETSALFLDATRSVRWWDESEIRRAQVIAARLADVESGLNNAILRAYGFEPDAIAEVESLTRAEPSSGGAIETVLAASWNEYAFSFLFGVAVGRWSLAGVATSTSTTTGPVDFYLENPLPRTPPAFSGLDSAQSAGASPALLVDEPGALSDVLQTVEVLLQDPCAVEASLPTWDTLRQSFSNGPREWLRTRFFDFHLELYSVGRRSAPIYWQLATPSASYSVWVYIHRFSKDTLFKVLNDHVLPKLQREERRLSELQQEAGPSPTKSQREALSHQETFVDELRAFRDEVKRVAPLWDPDLDDGVVINAAPLWRLFPQHKAWQKEVKGYWDDLVAGKYDWAHLAMHLWPERVVPACTSDRSFAIAHDLEAELWEERADGKWHPREVAPARVAELIAARTRPAVKAALKDLLGAPAPVASRARAPRATRPRAARSEAAPAAPRAGVDEAILTQVLASLAAQPDGLTKAGLVARTGLSDRDCKAALDALIAARRAHKTGAARGTRYHAGGESPS